MTAAPLATLLLAALPAADGTANDPAPRLVVLLVVDQCRTDYFDRFGARFTGFFARLRDEGRWFTDGEQHHALTVTAAGHAALGTGRFPSRNGIVGNDFFDPATNRITGAANDPAAAPLGGRGGGFSSHRLQCDGLGDWWKRAHPDAKVAGVSIKPRSAIFPLGKGPHAAWWFDDRKLGFATSARCVAELPAWATAAFARDPFAGFPSSWERTLSDAECGELGCTQDDQDGEAPTGNPPSRSFPHGLAGKTPDQRANALLVSPWADALVLDFARDVVVGEEFGADAVPDLLAVGLSATDLIGHRHGPDSVEIAEQLLWLDGALEEFVSFLDARCGGELLIALSSDHGIPPLPEVAKARGKAGDRVDWATLQPIVDAALIAIDPRLAGAAQPIPEFGIRLDRMKLVPAGLVVDDVARALAAKLRTSPPFTDARSHAELQAPLAEDDRAGELLRASSDGARAGDLLFTLAPGTIYIPAPARVAQLKNVLATSHGTPWSDDTRVPIVFVGTGVAPGRIAGRAWTVDVAPTLATAVGAQLPADLDGKALPLH